MFVSSENLTRPGSCATDIHCPPTDSTDGTVSYFEVRAALFVSVTGLPIGRPNKWLYCNLHPIILILFMQIIIMNICKAISTFS